MKILITNYYLDNFCGSELFTRDLSFELKKRGFEVYVFSIFLGKVSNEMKENGVFVTDNVKDFENINFDIIHAQHNITAIIARSIFPKTPMIFMSHGVLPDLEQPSSINLGISKYVAVSEEVEDSIIKNYKIKKENITILRNFVNFLNFYSHQKIRKNLEKVLVLSNHYIDEVKFVIEKACKDLKIECLHVGLPENPVDDVAKYINDADLVVTLGRGVLETMACARNVIVYDMNGGDGFIDENNFFKIRKNNFSGRNKKLKFSVDDFKKELLKYDSELGEKLKNIVLKENNVNKVVDSLCLIYNEAIKNNKFSSSKIGKNELFRELSFLSKTYFWLDLSNKNKDLAIEGLKNQISNSNNLITENNLLLTTHQKNEQKIQQLNNEIILIKSSKFWKLRENYLICKGKIKFAIFCPKKFIKKYFL